MDNISIQKLEHNIQQTQAYDKYRKYWLIASSFVVAVILGVVFEWNYIQQERILWVIASLGLTTTAIWWYWTMRFVRHLIVAKTQESLILIHIVKDISYVQKEVLKNFSGIETSS